MIRFSGVYGSDDFDDDDFGVVGIVGFTSRSSSLIT